MHSDADPSGADPGDAESGTEGGSDLIDAFMATVAGLTEGELLFPAPFDLASSAALSDNVDAGSIAQRLFDVSVQRECRYRVSIHQLGPTDRPDSPSRALLDTTVPSSDLLVHLLDDLSAELEARRHHH